MEALSVKFVEPGRAVLVKEPLSPDVPGKHEIVMRTECSLISPGTELALFGRDAPVSNDLYPFQPGYAAVGEVLAAGHEVAGVKPGDRILAHTPHSSLVRFDASDIAWAKVPPGVDSRQAVFVRLATVSMTTLRTTATRPGDSVAVLGLGPVGFCAAQVFRAVGYQVTGIDLLASRCTRLRATGIDALQATPDALAEFTERMGGVHLVIEATGSTRAALTAVEIAATGGEISLVGFNWGRKSDVDASAILSLIFQKYLRMRSGFEWELAIKETGANKNYKFQVGPTRTLGAPFTAGSIEANMDFAFALLAQGRLDFAPALTHVIDPIDAQKAYDGLLDDRDNYQGVLFDWTSTVGLP